VDVAVQPLMFPYDGFVLGLGAQLNQFGRESSHLWWTVPTEKPEMQQTVEQFAQTVIASAVPWLDRFQSSHDVVEIDTKDDWGVFPIEWSTRTELVGLCALDAEMYDRAEQLLNQAFEKGYGNLEESANRAGIDVPEWARARRQMYQELLGLLEKGDYEEIQRRLAEYRAHTWKALELVVCQASFSL